MRKQISINKQNGYKSQSQSASDFG